MDFLPASSGHARQAVQSEKPLMKKTFLLGLAALMLPVVAFAQAQPTSPPVAPLKPYQVKGPGGISRDDPYYWLRDDTRKNPEMLAYLNGENAYADAVLAPTKPLQEKLYGEFVGRIKQDDSTVPYRKRGYFYYSRFEPGQDYPVVARRKGAMTAGEEVLLDQPAMGKDKGYFQIGGYEVSPDNRLLAFAEDVVGRRQYVLRVKDIATGRLLAEVPNAEPDFVWADDNRTLFYVEKDPVTLLSKRVKAHVLGTPASADRLVYEEKDDSFYMGLGRTTSDEYICILLQSTVSNEQRCTRAASPGAFAVFAPREREFRYQADHIGDRWVILTNWKAPNYRLMRVAEAAAAGGRAKWTDLVPHSANVFIDDFKPMSGYIAIAERSGGNKRLRLLTDAGKSSFVASDEPAYAMGLDVNAEPGTEWLRYHYTSLTTPTRIYEVNARSGQRRLLKETPAPGYDASRYVTERVWATARDGTKIPVSLVYRKGFRKDGKAAMLQYAYGSYGISSDPAWSPTVTSLLDRGMVYALAHIRGGQEMGRAWYDQGHLLNKKNSFTDFIDVTRYLVAQGYAAKDRVAAQGGSAGGLLMGGIANMAPEDYKVIVAQVPFVDAVTTMLDASIPLTTNEYDEWGNPSDRKYYDYMLSYSPYDNVAARAYPAMFVSTGLWDSQVQYYEPAKWVAKLRAAKTDSNPLLFRINMEAGHGGKSGRFRRYRDIAEYYAFMLNQLGVEG
jgi:oligopeptidase B